jgi:hypothetical protein
MKTSKGMYFWFSIFAICFISYQQVSDNIRPFYKGDNLTIAYFLGIAPNFFPAIGIPSLFLILIPGLQPKNKWLKDKKHIAANLISLTCLISWEFIQISSTKLHFDWNDVVWTLIGAFIFHLIFIFIPKSFKELND